MPRNHRAGRRVQLRKLKWQFCNTPATYVDLLGVPETPTIAETEETPKFGYILVLGQWAAPKLESAQGINGVPDQPIYWKLTPLDQ